LRIARDPRLAISRKPSSLLGEMWKTFQKYRISTIYLPAHNIGFKTPLSEKLDSKDYVSNAVSYCLQRSDASLMDVQST
jgi:hypothetical protein